MRTSVASSSLARETSRSVPFPDIPVSDCRMNSLSMPRFFLRIVRRARTGLRKLSSWVSNTDFISV